MCADCVATSSSSISKKNNSKITSTIRGGDDEDTALRCSCCDASLEASEDDKFNSPCSLIRPSREVLGDIRKPSSGGAVDVGFEDEIKKEGPDLEQSRSDLGFVSIGNEMVSVFEKIKASEEEGCRVSFSTRKVEEEEEPLIGVDFSSSREDLSLDEAANHGCHREEEASLEFYIDSDDFRLIPVGKEMTDKCEGLGEIPGENSDTHRETHIELDSRGVSALEPTVALLETLEFEENHQAARVSLAEDGGTDKEVCEEVDVPETTRRLLKEHDDGGINLPHFPIASEEVHSMCNGPVHTGERSSKARPPDVEIQEDPSTTSCTLYADGGLVDKMVEAKNESSEAVISVISDVTDGERINELQTIQGKHSTYSGALHAGSEQVVDEMEEVTNAHAEAEISVKSDITDWEQIDEFKILQEDPSNNSCALSSDESHGSKQVVDEMAEGKNILVEAEISIKSEITDEVRFNELKSLREDPSTNSCTLHAGDSHGSKQAVDERLEGKNISVDAEILITSDFTKGEWIDELQNTQEDPSTNICTSHADDSHGSKREVDDIVDCKNISLEMSMQTVDNHSSLDNLHEIVEHKVPDTPSSADNLHKKIQTLEKREWEAEESLDGSVMSEFEGSEGVLTMEHLKLTLKAERKALNALYLELDEERSASAIAANQTMAMINRLQEEKAAMQMESLQYQRMMEEQSEYDQEALQLLNELIVKRERENQELEKELKIYRKKVMDYEAKEKVAILRRRESRDGSTRSQASSTSCSNCEDSDGQSTDLNQEGKEEESLCSHQESGNEDNHMVHTPADVVFNLDDSLVNFEEERLSILEHLRDLEEKLFTLSDEGEHLDVMKLPEQFYEESGKELIDHFELGGELNGVANGFPNGKHYQESRIVCSKTKTLLPFFDAISGENEENGVASEGEGGFDSVIVPLPSLVTKFKLESKNQAIEEEVDHLYERLQALEADREFLKHCIGSLKKGDKGTDLLQEILQHLRDLKNVELRVRSVGDGPLV